MIPATSTISPNAQWVSTINKQHYTFQDEKILFLKLSTLDTERHFLIGFQRARLSFKTRSMRVSV